MKRSNARRASALVATALVLANGCAGAARQSVGVNGHHAAPAPAKAQERAPAPPRLDRIVLQEGGRLVVLSGDTGRIVATVAGPAAGKVRADRASPLVPTPDGRAMYTTLVGRAGLRIVRLTFATGELTLVAQGAIPSVSPNGTQLAYVSPNGDAVVVRKLATGATETVPVGRFIGDGASLLNTGSSFLVWFGEHRLVALAGPDGSGGTTNSAAEAPVAAGGSGDCTASIEPGGPGQCALIVDLTRRPTVHLVFLGRLSETLQIAGAGPGRTLLVGSANDEIERFDVGATTVHAAGVVTVGPSDPVLLALSPDGRKVLFLIGPAPSRLDDATISATTVSDVQVLQPAVTLFGAGW